MKAANRRLLSPLLLWFMGTMILANIAGRMIGPLESLYVQELGASVGQVGLFFTLASILPLAFQWFGGMAVGQEGRAGQHRRRFQRNLGGVGDLFGRDRRGPGGTVFGLFATSLDLVSLTAPWIGARLCEGISPILPF